MGLEKVPASLKESAPFVLRANEIDRVDGVVAYWCLYYSAQLGIEKKSSDKEAQAYLLGLMDELERRKGAMSSNDAITDDTAGYAYLENFALNVFNAADKDDRDGKASRSTARAFATANKLFDVLQVFGALNEDISSRSRYAKWKAADISKALRENRKPVPGPANQPDEEAEVEATLASLQTEASTTPFGAAEDADAPRDVETKDTTPKEPEAPGGVQFPSAPTALGDPHHGATAPPSSGSPEPIKPPRDRENAAPKPAPASVPARTAAPAPAKPAAAPMPAAPPQAGAPAAEPEQTSSSRLTVEEHTRVQKLARWVSSALDYDDIDTARSHLREALSLLDGVAGRTGPQSQ